MDLPLKLDKNVKYYTLFIRIRVIIDMYGKLPGQFYHGIGHNSYADDIIKQMYGRSSLKFKFPQSVLLVFCPKGNFNFQVYLINSVN